MTLLRLFVLITCISVLLGLNYWFIGIEQSFFFRGFCDAWYAATTDVTLWDLSKGHGQDLGYVLGVVVAFITITLFWICVILLLTFGFCFAFFGKLPE